MPTSFQHYQVRIHRRWDETETVLKKLSDISDHSVVFEHPPDEKVKRIHVHAYFFNLNLKDDAIRERLKKTGLKGNEDFAVSGQCGDDRRPLDLSGAWTYGTKPEALRPVFTNNISPAVIEELQEYARCFYAKYKRDNITPAASSQGDTKVKKMTHYEHIRQMSANCLTPEFLKLDDGHRVAVVRDEVWQYLRSNGIKSCKRGLVEWTEAVLLDLDDKCLKEAVTWQLEKNLNIFISRNGYASYPYVKKAQDC